MKKKSKIEVNKFRNYLMNYNLVKEIYPRMDEIVFLTVIAFFVLLSIPAIYLVGQLLFFHIQAFFILNSVRFLIAFFKYVKPSKTKEDTGPPGFEPGSSASKAIRIS